LHHIVLDCTHIAACLKYLRASVKLFSPSSACPTLLNNLALFRFTRRPAMKILYSVLLW